MPRYRSPKLLGLMLLGMVLMSLPLIVSLANAIAQVDRLARESRHEFLTVEHMLLALLDNASALGVLSACGVDSASLEKEILKVLMLALKRFYVAVRYNLMRNFVGCTIDIAFHPMLAIRELGFDWPRIYKVK